MSNYNVVDVVGRDTAKLLEDTDATLAYHDDRVYVLDERDGGEE